MDFFTTEVWTPRGLTTYYVLFLIDLKTRRTHVAGITTAPDTAFMPQMARNLTDPVDGFLRGHRFVICDRDTKFAAPFRSILTAAGGGRVIRTPVQAPNANAYAERFVLSMLLVHPAGERDDEELKHLQKRRHVGERTRRRSMLPNAVIGPSST